MIKILISAMNYAPELTGCGKYTGELGAEFVRRGHSVEVVTTAPHYPGWEVKMPYANRWSTDRVSGATVYRCPVLVRKAMSGFWRLIAPASFAATSAPVTLWRSLKFRPNVVLAIEPTLMAAPVALLAAKLVGARAIVHIQDLEIDAAFAVGHLAEARWLRWLGKVFERFCLKRFDRIITISHKMAELLVEKGISGNKIEVIRNWVDLNHIRPVSRSLAYRDELGLPSDAYVVLYSGNVGPKQGLEVVVDAARILSNQTNIVFAIAGDGPSRADLQVRAADLPNVHFLPFQPYERLPDFFGACDLQVLPQQASAGDLVLPSKLGGMLASGKPIVVTAEGETELEVFLRGAATIVPPGNANALADAVRSHVSHQVPDTASHRVNLAKTLSLPETIDRLEQAVCNF